MDEAALIPTIQYVMLTVLLAAWAVRSFEWLRVTAVSVGVVAVVVVFETGLTYEGLKRTMRY